MKFIVVINIKQQHSYFNKPFKVKSLYEILRYNNGDFFHKR